MARVSQTHLAAVMGCTRQAVAKWACPKNRDGSYDLAKVIVWYVGKQIDQALREAPEEKSLIDRMRSAKVRKAEIEVAKLEERLIEAEPVEQRWAETVTRFANALVQLEDSLSPRLEMVPASMARSLLGKALRATLEGLQTCPTQAS